MTKEEITKLIKVPGKVRGQPFITDIEYLKNKVGEEGVVLLKKKIKEWGDLFDYEKIETMEWYPIGFRVLSLLAIKETFNWGDKEIFDLGNAAPKHSFIVKLLMKYFLSPLRTFQESPKYWEKHYNIGGVECVELNEKKKYGIVRVKNFKIHPIFCIFHRGYFLRLAQYVLKSDKITIEETKCMFKEDPYHEFLIKWE